jgi:hypothetical protein
VGSEGTGKHRGNSRAPRRLGVLLWIAAVVLMLAAAAFQRITGPTHPLRGSANLGGTELSYRLVRSGWSEATSPSTRVVLADPFAAGEGPPLEGDLHFRRLRSAGPYAIVPLRRERVDGGGLLVGELPAQPAAGKLEYFLTVRREGNEARIPTRGATAVIRFKDHVPTTVLLPHIVAMFFAMLFGMRAGLGALFHPRGMRTQVLVAFAGMTVGGMILGPIVQKHAFGAYWTGFPLGGDWTDNKTLLMWLCWVLAGGIVVVHGRPERSAARAAVALAALVMSVVYLIPHSTRGSELDYTKVDAGVDPSRAVETGR